ncbi:MAG: hypothetical protein KDA42_16685, partial [Planctomycetales bacterium]|nr:hypothetical protein [Planctomycetales bacterium]
MLAIERWGEVRFKPMAMIAQLAAFGAETIHDGVTLSLDGRIRDAIEWPDRARWLDCWKKPFAVEGVMLSLMDQSSNVQEAEEMRVAWPRARRRIKRELAGTKLTDRDL